MDASDLPRVPVTLPPADAPIRWGDIARCLQAFGFIVAHVESGAQPQSNPIAGAPQVEETHTSPGGADLPGEPRRSSTAAEERAWPLTSPEVAQAFADLRGWSQEQWSKKLGDAPDWLLTARRTPGAPGVCAATWDPVQIGDLLISRFNVPVKSVRARFQTRESLRAWRTQWEEHEATYYQDAQ